MYVCDCGVCERVWCSTYVAEERNSRQAFKRFWWTGCGWLVVARKLFNSCSNLITVFFLMRFALICSRLNQDFWENVLSISVTAMQEMAAVNSPSRNFMQNLSLMIGGGGTRPERTRWSHVISRTCVCTEWTPEIIDSLMISIFHGQISFHQYQPQKTTEKINGTISNLLLMMIK